MDPFKLETLFELFVSAGDSLRQLFLKGPGSYIIDNVLSAVEFNNLILQNVAH